MRIILFLIFISLVTPIAYAQQSTQQILKVTEKMEQAHQLDSAIAYLTKNIANVQTDSSYALLLKRGYLNMNQNKDALALADFEYAYKINGQASQAQEAMGYLFLKTNKFELATQHFTKAIEMGNNSASVYFCRAHAYWDLKNCTASLKDLDICLKLDPHHDNANYLKGRVYAYLGKHQQAVEEYNVAMTLVTLEKQAEVMGYRGISYMVLHQRHLAEEDLKKSIEGGMHRIEITTAYEAVRTRK